MAGIPLGSGFSRTSGQPLDLFDTVADQTARDAIPTGVRYQGMTVYSVADEMTYQLQGGVSNADWAEAGGGSGGGGVTVAWSADVNAPLAVMAAFPLMPAPNWDAAKIPSWQFDAGLAQRLIGIIKVPQSYKIGKPITVRGLFTSTEATTATVLFKAYSYLFEKDTTSTQALPWEHASTNAAIAQGAALASRPREFIVDISDSAGEIESRAVAPGDMIVIVLDRGTDTSTLPALFFPSTSEVLFA